MACLGRPIDASRSHSDSLAHDLSLSGCVAGLRSANTRTRGYPEIISTSHRLEHLNAGTTLSVLVERWERDHWTRGFGRPANLDRGIDESSYPTSTNPSPRSMIVRNTYSGNKVFRKSDPTAAPAQAPKFSSIPFNLAQLARRDNCKRTARVNQSFAVPLSY